MLPTSKAGKNVNERYRSLDTPVISKSFAVNAQAFRGASARSSGGEFDQAQTRGRPMRATGSHRPYPLRKQSSERGLPRSVLPRRIGWPAISPTSWSQPVCRDPSQRRN